jgi:PAS domain S-box-containing protein
MITQMLLFFEIIESSKTILNFLFFISIVFIIPFYNIVQSWKEQYKSIKDDKNELIEEYKNMNNFVNTASIVSKTDKNGKIIYVNKKFEEISGYILDEVFGKDHSIVNSGFKPKSYWTDMYRKVVKGETWNDIVVNKRKDGELYWVDTYIKADFDKNGKILGFSSIRQDLTETKVNESKIQNLMDSISRSNAIVEFDLNGNILKANQIFLDITNYKESELIGKNHSILLDKEYSQSEEYKQFWEKLKVGNFHQGEYERIKKGGESIWIQASYNPVYNVKGEIYKIFKIANDITEKHIQTLEINKKNTYLEHAAKILRHDMHSGINTYIPRGIKSLERRLDDETIKTLKIESPLKMIKEGLNHTQKVYKGVYEFTNLVKKDKKLDKENVDLKEILDDYLKSTSYKSQIIIDQLIEKEVNQSLFCTAIDNLIRNGLKYNDSPSKLIKIYMEDNCLIVQDNGRGITNEEFKELSKPYVRKENQSEGGSGLGLNITLSILEEHGFQVSAEKLEKGTKIKIKL